MTDFCPACHLQRGLGQAGECTVCGSPVSPDEVSASFPDLGPDLIEATRAQDIIAAFNSTQRLA